MDKYTGRDIITKLTLLCFLLIFLIHGECVAFAMNTGFETKEYDANTYQELINSINITVSPVQRIDSIVRSFSVSEFGDVAVCLGSGDVNIYDSNGVFKYRYSLSRFTTYCLEWNQRNLLIQYTRGDYIISIDENGNILELLDTNIRGSSNTDYAYRTERIKKFTCNNDTYEVLKGSGTNSPLSGGYSKVVKTSADGSKTIIYDASKALFRESLLVLLFYVIALFMVLFDILKSIWTQKLKKIMPTLIMELRACLVTHKICRYTIK